MSKFIDKLGQVSQAVAQPMGFRAGAGAQPKPKLLLVASVSKPEGVADLVAGADTGLARVPELGGGAFKKVLQAAPDIPWGAWIRDTSGEKLAQVLDSCDFVVFPEEGTALAMFQGEEIGKVLAVEASLADGLVRAVDKLPVDAVLISYEQEAVLTWHHLAQIQRCADLLAKPLLVFIPASAGAPELQAMLTAGVSGVVAAVGAGQSGRVQELRKDIDGLKPPPKRKRGKVDVMVPFVSGRVVEEAAEEPDEEEEEEEE